jgi:hypothetical protein
MTNTNSPPETQAYLELPACLDRTQGKTKEELDTELRELNKGTAAEQKILSPHEAQAALDPVSALLKNNIRAGAGDLTELRQSMQQFGWVEEFPALLDENDVVLVGDRRLKVAKELGLKPVTKKLTLGAGSKADAERLKIALASNIGFAPMSKEDRQRIAEHLYGEHEWTMQRIAEALKVSTRQISKDLHGFEPSSKPPRPKGGRPKGTSNRRPVIAMWPTGKNALLISKVRLTAMTVDELQDHILACERYSANTKNYDPFNEQEWKRVDGMKEMLAQKKKALAELCPEATPTMVVSPATMPPTGKAALELIHQTSKPEPRFSRLTDVSTLHASWNAATKEQRQIFVDEIGLVELYTQASPAQQQKLTDMITARATMQEIEKGVS